MCLAVPGKILSVKDEGPLMREGKVDFGGVTRSINLAYVPEANQDDWVLVHAGFAINTIDEEEAHRTLEELQQLGAVGGGMITAEEADTPTGDDA